MPSVIVFSCHGNQTRFFRSARNLSIISNYEFRSEGQYTSNYNNNIVRRKVEKYSSICKKESAVTEYVLIAGARKLTPFPAPISVYKGKPPREKKKTFPKSKAVASLNR